MSRPTSTFGWRLLVVLLGLLFVGRPTQAFAARNEVLWNFVGLPATGTTGQTISFTASVTNIGSAAWRQGHYLELRDSSGVKLDFVELIGTSPNNSKIAQFTLALPEKSGAYTYAFRAVEHGFEYFGQVLERTITVRKPPLNVTLALDETAIFVGERAVVRSAVAQAEVAAHGLEIRPVGGKWQRWSEWKARAGEQQIAAAGLGREGIYEMRAFAVRADDDEVTYSPRALLTVFAIPPAITTQPIGAVVNVGESVSLAVTATGTDPQFQWRKEGAPIPGATTADFALSPAQVAQSGTYDVVVANRAGTVISRPAAVAIHALRLPAMSIEVRHFPAAGGQRAVALNAAQVGDVVSISSGANLTAGTGWRHNVLLRRPAITAANALAPEDGSGFSNAHEAWNKHGWGSPHLDGDSYDATVVGAEAPDLGRREPFVHLLSPGQRSSTRAFDFVLDAPGAWLIRAEILDGAGQLIAESATTTVQVAAPVLATEPGEMTYPYGRDDRFVGVFWNAGQAHRLWSTWRAEYQQAYAPTWAVNWKLMWQPSPYFRRRDGGWLQPTPAADSPWQPFWSAHQVYAIVPHAHGAGILSHDLTSRAFAEKAAVRLMDIGVDFVAVDYTNQFLEEQEDVFPAVNNLALAFQSVAQRSQSGQRIKLSAVVPANVDSGDWGANGGFAPVGIARFNAKLSTIYERFARFESAWFHLEDDDGTRKPLLLLWVGATGEDQADGQLGAAKLNQLRIADGRMLSDVFTIRWVGAYLPNNRRFLTGASYTVNLPDASVSGQYANPKFWSYHETFPAAATVAPGASGATPAVEAITVQPLATGRDRFGRAWDMNWPAEQGYHYETPAKAEPVPLALYGKTWRDALLAARALNPKFLLTTWAEFGSENDEPRPELSVTIMDNNKFGTHFGDALKQAVRLFKYRAPTAWVDTYTIGEASGWINELAAGTALSLRRDQQLRLQGWVTPNVATTFAGGSVKVYVDDQLRGTATVGGAWNGATRWHVDLTGEAIGVGQRTIKVVVEDGAGGSALAGVQFRGDPPRNTVPLVVGP